MNGRATTVGAFDLEGWLAGLRTDAEGALERVLERWEASLPEDVAGAVRHGITGGGKRLRPIMCVAAYHAVGGAGDAAAVHDLGASIELVHAYSLMHDDLPCMDDAELRRGRSTTHRVHGEEVTVRAGAALIPLAVLEAFSAVRALGASRTTATQVALELCRAAGAGGMVGGQALDLLGEGQRLSGPELEQLHALKTGALLKASLRMGALAAGADDGVLGALDAFGRNVGLAFQIADDILDATASVQELGKNPSDAALEKSTYVSLHGLDGARRSADEAVARAIGALASGGVEAPALAALAHYVIQRRR